MDLEHQSVIKTSKYILCAYCDCTWERKNCLLVQPQFHGIVWYLLWCITLNYCEFQKFTLST